jgi:hypothetical protein
MDERNGKIKYSPRAPNKVTLAGIILSSRQKERNRVLKRFLTPYSNFDRPCSKSGLSLGGRAGCVADFPAAVAP